ncbi:MAG: putative selenate reductase subunit YgfK [Parafannyhessea umbonata]|jgi:putative selenate reductase|uniref:putative selenate reductase subunit YgfK n=1 Tax=Parafannyhessea umbonata TaxID=604330 RepID=UPI0026F2621A|nr:putative selenate reductase subunit YgfK [Parafannyhessea umbonata]MCI6681261.1 putative selenate reductase subunit YgfK [Parafannyhessea umbonata]MCI7218086.1 putative selenate reductase subunit YgfK [Parafannyhessea umbonata]MDD6359071.1 putative selenate reductase subunit YgfK [Parafannyhessea umbonata]MDD6565343.1 putative selenate reductase subunit YgfK [Parafannyhessea umbonata]MDY4418639.1 putative selenate reductase subunit YgfK [Parafannyhessea umbonata]
MSDIMRPMSFDHLMTWILDEYESQQTIFGQRRLARTEPAAARPIFGEKIETPFGPAAGPNTQLAQNIIASYVTGARFFELKTVQKMDGAELSACVNKPCILASDEGYNCEWSTELTVPQAFGEYVKAWVACKLLAREFGFGDPDGFVFNMSVGYDLEGIKTPKVDSFINGMKDASATPEFKEAIAWAHANVDRFRHVDAAFVDSITPHISDSITESTLHGCPPAEIERIATHLICEKGLNTYIKCNPTLLGYEYARKTLDSLGFGYIAFDSHHFDEDLQWADAVPMMERLQRLAAERGVEFGVKLTNTFPVDVTRGELPSEEMYMSGRALYPLSLTLAKRIAEQFDGKIRISYSGGATANNIFGLVDAGIWPVTMATNELKPGGYARFVQVAEVLSHQGDAGKPFAGVDAAKVSALVDAALTGGDYRKPIKPEPDRHVLGELPLTDCFVAPCREDCPIRQDIPGYVQAVGEGRYADALNIILERNALPFTTGTICPHTCGNSCMRNYYEEHVHIRDLKLKAAEKAFDDVLGTLSARGHVADRKVAIIGGGPAGLSAASFLSRAGVDVTVFERTNSLGGVVRHVIPGFRISDEAIDHDVELCSAYGAKFELGREVASAGELLAQGYTDVVVAVGAWAPGRPALKSGKALDALEFLEAFKSDPASLKLGTDVVVVGGGNTAMDVARAAKRVPGVKNVRLAYRRTSRYMPADEEELTMALADGVEFLELLAPDTLENGVLTCDVMELGEPDASGRRRPVATGQTREVPATAVIAAVGERVDGGVYAASGCELDEKGLPVVDATLQTSVPHVFAVGDCRRGPATVVKAIADAQVVARAIANASFDAQEESNIAAEVAKVFSQRGNLCADCASTDKTRCLSCAAVCETCVEVCPNRANVAVRVPGMRQAQIVHVDGMCNECGNCAVFCPYSQGRPYKDKLTLFWSREDFDDSTNEGWLPTKDGALVRLGGTVATYDVEDAACGLPEDVRKIIVTVRDKYAYLQG